MKPTQIINKTLKTAAGLLLAVLMLGISPSWGDGVSAIDGAIETGDLAQAAQIARSVDGSVDPATDLTMVLARLGRAFQKAGDIESSAEFYSRAAFASAQPAAASQDPEKIVFVRLAAAGALAQTGKSGESIRILKVLLSPPSAATPTQVQSGVSIALQIGGTSLARGDAVTAAEAYSLAAAHADAHQRPKAKLGDAWATAISQTQPVQAAKKLAAFVDEFPQHSDAPRAMRACAECLRQAERPNDSAAVIADLLTRWPTSATASEVVAGYSDVASEMVPPAVKDWIIGRAKGGEVKDLNAKATELGIKLAAETGDSDATKHLIRHLAAIDQDGNSVMLVLTSMVDQGKPELAEQWAATLISPMPNDKVSTAAREAACRWAGRTERWSMLALASASELERLDQASESRSVVVERLFAESLMQTGRVEEGRKWWDHLVDRRKSTDFATLLRCAEAETSVGTDVTLAGSRISLARAAATGDRFNETLVDMLAAELAIRKTRFDEARSLLESVVRSSDIDATVRGRAQWLIGETHFLQTQYAAAIEAYRRVEGIDASGVWVSAALVQAGKSFEQLGRTREAAVCYGSLIGRFADSPHAQVARRRMAAIDPANSPSNPSLRR
ncbi:Anaphase-promoting complex, cyclosome, subunit 3 [Rubripirellula tenax]|uniref:Anaphase-promoting complex, cyclosome, subunit 3 n=1 Tax=Rubripirellula tenax TaxID=2528015 RepID=A0A5C6EHB7_9BACT|nr:tetratricopeptide repeat protein [Rubripirellula tenax]TWU47437.1 Anaphase-promoting complex, cyclosome, subunit 3 [Rubripirellula tenax]